MSEQDAQGDAGVRLKLSDRPKRTSSEDNVNVGNGTSKVHSVRPRCGSYSWVVCFGIDDSMICEQSFNWYLDNLHREGSYLVLINCVELPCLYSYHYEKFRKWFVRAIIHRIHKEEVYTPSAMWQTALRREAEKTQQLEEKYVNKLKCHNIAGRYVIRDGKPGEGILKLAAECDADMIVVGTRGLGKVRRTVLGSVSSYVIHHAHVPVIVCRPRGPHEHNDIRRKQHPSGGGGRAEGTSPGVHYGDG